MSALAELLSRSTEPRMSPYVQWGVRDSDLTTTLPPGQEQAFRSWLQQYDVPFNPDAKGPTDYDMRGYYRAFMAGDPRAAPTQINPNDNQPHFTDYWKTPYHESFSQQSQWAGPHTPEWNAQDQLTDPAGNVVFDERNGGTPAFWRNR